MSELLSVYVFMRSEAWRQSGKHKSRLGSYVGMYMVQSTHVERVCISVRDCGLETIGTAYTIL
jgi:hypothetical protein